MEIYPGVVWHTKKLHKDTTSLRFFDQTKTSAKTNLVHAQCGEGTVDDFAIQGIRVVGPSMFFASGDEFNWSLRLKMINKPMLTVAGGMMGVGSKDIHTEIRAFLDQKPIDEKDFPAEFKPMKNSLIFPIKLILARIDDFDLECEFHNAKMIAPIDITVALFGSASRKADY